MRVALVAVGSGIVRINPVGGVAKCDEPVVLAVSNLFTRLAAGSLDCCGALVLVLELVHSVGTSPVQ
jgi:hypothetical protein